MQRKQQVVTDRGALGRLSLAPKALVRICRRKDTRKGEIRVNVRPETSAASRKPESSSSQ